MRPATISVIRAGMATTIQDAGRPGLSASGIGRSGAADRGAYELANRLVGNDAGAAVIETSGALVVRIDRAVLLALTGASAEATVDSGAVLEAGPAAGARSSAATRSATGPGTSIAHCAPTSLPAGSVIRIAVPRRGLRTYLAFRGGIAVPSVLCSRSRDTLAALGPIVTDGSVLTIGDDPRQPVLVDVAPQRERPSVVRVMPGPRRDWFTEEAWVRISSGVYTVDQSTSRVGARLHGATLQRARRDELPSEGMVLGAIQVPHNLQPIVMLADHPVTGGYPVIAVAHPDDVAIVAQAAPGTSLRFATVR